MNSKIVRTVCKTNEQWREERSHSVGASSIGILLGENPWTSPMELKQRMTDELLGNFDYSENPAMIRGHAYESGVAYMFQHYTGLSIIQSSSKEYVVRRSDIPFMHASPDRTYWIDARGIKNGKNAEANKGILECKTTRRPIDPENLPLSWQFQLQVQMGICGYSEGYIAWDVLSIADGFGYKRFEFDQEIFDSAVKLCRDFWYNCIVNGAEPEPTCARDVISRYPYSVEGKVIQANAQAYELIDVIKELKASKRELEDAIDQSEEQLKLMFSDEETMVNTDGKPIATFKTRSGSMRVDSKKLKSHYPDVYFEVATKSADTRTLSIK